MSRQRSNSLPNPPSAGSAGDGSAPPDPSPDDISKFTPAEVMELLRRKAIPGVDMASLAHRPRCHPGTRASMLNREHRWKDLTWVTGPAGCGKSTYARALAEQSQENSLLGTALFFTHRHRRYDISRVLHTVIYHLAKDNQPYQSHFTSTISSMPEFIENPTSGDLYEMLGGPRSVRPPSLTKKQLIILDGLNECWDDAAQIKLVKLIEGYFSEQYLSSGEDFKWVICTRLSLPLRAEFSRPFKPSWRPILELSVTDSESTQDITRFLRDGFSDIRKQYSAEYDLQAWPTEAQSARLIKATSGYFPFAVSILQFVGNKERQDPVAQLLACLDFLDNPHLSAVNPLHYLDEIYRQLLSKVQKDVLPTALGIFRFCVNNSGRLCTLRIIEFVFRISRKEVYEALRDLYCVIDIPDSRGAETEGPRFYHPSFPVFLQDPRRSGEYTINTISQGVLTPKGARSVALSTTRTPGTVVVNTGGSPGSRLPEISAGRLTGLSRIALNRLNKVSAPAIGNGASSRQVPASSSTTDNGLPQSNYPQLNNVSKVLEITASLLSRVLETSQSRKALLGLKGDRAQLMANYLHSVLLEPSLPLPWLQKHSLIALRDLSRTSLVYPHCYALKDIIFDSYEGGGAFSDIHKGRYGGRQLCLKVVRLHQKSDTEAMLKIYAKEAILWGQLHHPNIVPLYGIYFLNEARRQVCLVSPWMRHGNLVDYLKINPSAPRPLLIQDIVAGLGYLHGQSLVHSDIKGMNILVNDSERACITDFGLSFIRTDQTLAYTFASSSTRGFSHHWAAPELLEDGARATLASDVWALGCVFYEVLTGSLPYGTSSDAQIIRRIMRGELPTRPNPTSSSGPAEDVIWKLVNRCWELEPTDRPTCRDISQDLKWNGIARDQEEGPDGATRERQDFQNAMRKNEEVPLDLGRIEQILNELCITAA